VQAGLGAVGRAELGQEMADVLLDGVEGSTSSRAMAWFDLPEASMPSTSSSRLVSGSTRPGIWRGVRCLERALQPGQAAEWNPSRRPARPAGPRSAGLVKGPAPPRPARR
jgi:hypothetical protein